MRVVKVTSQQRYKAKHSKPCSGGCGRLIFEKQRRCKACYRRERVERLVSAPPQLRHGYARKGAVHPVHSIWRDMIGRCTNERNPRYSSYGARGIKVCARWLVFENFLADVGMRPAGVGPAGRALYSLDRKDNDGDYEPGNVKWSTAVEQAQRTTRSVWISYRGERRGVAEWEAITGIPRAVLRLRVRRGWSPKRTLTEPVRAW